MFCSSLQQSAMHLQYCLTRIKGEDMISLVMRILSHKCTGTVMIMQEVLKVSDLSWYRTFKKFLSTTLIMNSTRLWNSHQMHKFLRAEVPRTSLKFRVLEMAFPEVSRGTAVHCIFHCGRHVVSSEYMQDWEQCRWNVPGIPLGK